MSRQNLIVEPVVELGLRTLQLSSSEVQLLHKIIDKAKKKNYIVTPDGWFVPIDDLRHDIRIVAEFIMHETSHYNEFEIGGGFRIFNNSQQLLDIPVDSTFRFAMDLENTIFAIKPGDMQKVSLGAQESWKISIDKNNPEMITFENGYRATKIILPHRPLISQFKKAQLLVENFSTSLEYFLKNYDEWKITTKNFRFIFGLDKIQ